jgi:uncharacterized DUF497 family protein
MTIDWHDAQADLAKHGVDFDEAESVFADPSAGIAPDPGHSEEGRRKIAADAL